MTRSELPTGGFQGLVFRVGVDEGAVKSREDLISGIMVSSVWIRV